MLANYQTEGLELVRRFAASYAAAARVVLLAGSRARGSFGPNSDYDVVLLYDHLPGGAWREMVRFEEADFEVFAHDLGTLSYFLREIERPSAKPVLAMMVVEGLPAVVHDAELLEAARQRARDLTAQGPIPFDAKQIDGHRYAITNLAEGLRDALQPAVCLSVGTSLYLALAEFALRSRGRWAASGKALLPALAEMDPGLERRFAGAFLQLMQAERSCAAVQELVDEILAPFGGRLRAGYRQEAPPSWRDECALKRPEAAGI